MAKVLIASIGTGRLNKKGDQSTREYQNAKYEIDGKFYETTFISDALSKHFSIDKTFLIGTPKSMWEEVYQKYTLQKCLEFSEDYYYDLAEKIDNANKDTKRNEINLEKVEKVLGENSKIFQIRYGTNERELAENFEAIFELVDYIEDGDEIYIDITHSFRSLSMYMYTIVNYLKEISDKNISIKGIYYGMLEILGENDGVAKVVNLNIINEINDWIKGSHEILSYGNFYTVARLLEEDGVDRNIINKLQNLSDISNINYVSSLRDNLRSILNFQEDIKAIGGVGSKIIPKVLKEFLDRFSRIKKDYNFFIELSKWYHENKRYSQAYIVLCEAILIYFAKKYDIEILSEYEAKEVKDKMFQKIDCNNIEVELVTIYSKINKVRNKIAHPANEKRNNSYKNDVQNLKVHIEKVEKYFNKLG